VFEDVAVAVQLEFLQFLPPQLLRVVLGLLDAGVQVILDAFVLESESIVLEFLKFDSRLEVLEFLEE
jgi:hypothetical protein